MIIVELDVFVAVMFVLLLELASLVLELNVFTTEIILFLFKLFGLLF